MPKLAVVFAAAQFTISAIRATSLSRASSTRWGVGGGPEGGPLTLVFCAVVIGLVAFVLEGRLACRVVRILLQRTAPSGFHVARCETFANRISLHSPGGNPMRLWIGAATTLALLGGFVACTDSVETSTERPYDGGKPTTPDDTKPTTSPAARCSTCRLRSSRSRTCGER